MRWFANTLLLLTLAGLGGALGRAFLEERILPSPAWGRYYATDARGAQYVARWFVVGWALGVPVLGFSALNWLTIQGVVGGDRARRGQAGRRPINRGKEIVAVGQAHRQDGQPSPNPIWIQIPSAGLFTGTLCLGATGSGKTKGVLEPMLRQILGFHAGDPERRWAGYVFDVKGNVWEDLQRWCRDVGREQDLYVVRIPDIRWNVIERQGMNPVALASALWQAIEGVEGAGDRDNPFFSQSAQTLAAQAIRLLQLADAKPATLRGIYRVTASAHAFEDKLAVAQNRAGAMSAGELSALEQLRFWHREQLASLDEKTRSNISATLNRVCALFDSDELAECFCPEPKETNFPGFEKLLDEGKIVVVSIPESKWKGVSRLIGTLAKLAFQDAVLARLERARQTGAAVRPTVLWADEADKFTTSDDATFYSLCRESRCAAILASQSLAGFHRRIRKPDAEMLFANLRNKIWLTLADVETSRAAAEMCGKTERMTMSVSRSESAAKSKFSVLDRQVLDEGGASSSMSQSWSPREQHTFRPDVFLKLPRFVGIMRAYDGVKVSDPWTVYLEQPDGSFPAVKGVA